MQIHRSIPTIVSLSRIILSFVLLLTFNVEYLFTCLVIIIGLTDIADGYIARKYNLVSKMGAMIDSLADLVFFAIILWILYFKYEWIFTENYNWFFIIVLLKILSAAISKIKHGKFIFIHTIANKITGLFVFISILILPFDGANNLIPVVFIVGLIAAAEELGIMIVKKTVDVNHTSIFK